jgi:hypothetical protein
VAARDRLVEHSGGQHDASPDDDARGDHVAAQRQQAFNRDGAARRRRFHERAAGERRIAGQPRIAVDEVDPAVRVQKGDLMFEIGRQPFVVGVQKRDVRASRHA